METLINLFSYYENEFIHLSTWIAGKNLARHYYFKKKIFMQKEIIMICMFKVIHYADIFESFRNKCIEIYELDSANFLPALRLVWQACLNMIEIKLELLTNVNILLMVEKEISGGICHAIHRYAEANNKYMKNYNKNKYSSNLRYLDPSNLYGEAMSQKLPVDGCKWKKVHLNLIKRL